MGSEASAKLDYFSSSPLLVVLRQVRDLGRERKGKDSELESVARRAHEALAWFEADSEGRFEAAQKHLDNVYA